MFFCFYVLEFRRHTDTHTPPSFLVAATGRPRASSSTLLVFSDLPRRWRSSASFFVATNPQRPSLTRRYAAGHRASWPSPLVATSFVTDDDTRPRASSSQPVLHNLRRQAVTGRSLTFELRRPRFRP